MPILSNFNRKNYDKFFSFDKIVDNLSKVLITVMFYAFVWGIFGEEAEPPNGYIFNAFLIYIFAHIFGEILQLFNLPALIAMLLIGFLFGNREMIGIKEINLNTELMSTLRYIGLVIIILRAGLELDPKTIVKMTAVCLRLSFIPSIVETLTVALFCNLFLDFPLKWGFLLGFLLSAVSPAVIVPPLLKLQFQGLGIDKGIVSLLLASASIDDILSITGFGVCFKMIFETESLTYILFKVPVEPLIGVMTGILMGLILWYIPAIDAPQLDYLFVLFFGGLSAQLVLKSLHMRAAGLEACFVGAFVASIDWRKNEINDHIEEELKILWSVFQPILFASIGSDVKISELTTTNFNYLFLIVCIGLMIRFIATLIIICCTGSLKLVKDCYQSINSFECQVAPVVESWYWITLAKALCNRFNQSVDREDID